MSKDNGIKATVSVVTGRIGGTITRDQIEANAIRGAPITMDSMIEIVRLLSLEPRSESLQ